MSEWGRGEQPQAVLQPARETQFKYQNNFSKLINKITQVKNAAVEQAHGKQSEVDVIKQDYRTALQELRAAQNLIQSISNPPKNRLEESNRQMESIVTAFWTKHAVKPTLKPGWNVGTYFRGV